MACADAMLDVFVPESFDLVTGMAILHHLIDPSHALVAACRALTPGGFAMFFEPFEFGHSILTLIFERIMSEASLRADSLDPMVLHFMHLFTEDARRRLGRDKSSSIFREVDDKWLFSESYLREVGKAAGFEKSEWSRYTTQRTRSPIARPRCFRLAPTRSFPACRHGRRRSSHKPNPHFRKREAR